MFPEYANALKHLLVQATSIFFLVSFATIRFILGAFDDLPFDPTTGLWYMIAAFSISLAIILTAAFYLDSQK